MVEGEVGPSVVVEFHEDEILPKSITHDVELSYNFIRYEFETINHFYWARSYLKEIDKVAIYGPFQSPECSVKVKHPIDARIIDYLKRRYQKVEYLTETGYNELQ